MKRQDRSHDVIQVDEGLNGRELSLLVTAGSTLVITIAVSIAVWRISTGIMWALIILSVGSAGQTVLVGLGLFLRLRDQGRALVIEARGQATAAALQARAALAAQKALRHTGDQRHLERAA